MFHFNKKNNIPIEIGLMVREITTGILGTKEKDKKK